MSRHSWVRGMDACTYSECDLLLSFGVFIFLPPTLRCNYNFTLIFLNFVIYHDYSQVNAILPLVNPILLLVHGQNRGKIVLLNRGKI